MDRDPLFIFISDKGGLIKRGSSHHAPHFTLPTTTIVYVHGNLEANRIDSRRRRRRKN